MLDIGHVWTIYQYFKEWGRQPRTDFFGAFLDEFPLGHVIQIHIAGLDLGTFVDFWLEGLSVSQKPYDVFLLTLGRFVECVKQNMPDQMDTEMREATDMRRAYQDASSQVWVG